MPEEITKNQTAGKRNEAQAMLRYLRIAPRKVRAVASVLKNHSVNNAEAQLMLHPRRSAQPILKLLHSALANAKAKKLAVEKLVIKDIRVDQGPMLKRWIPRAQGRATPIHKHTSHVVIVLGESEKPVSQRFVTEIKKVKKEKKETEHAYKHEHEHGESEEQKKKLVTKEKEVETRKEVKAPKKGFVQKLFRRKSI